MRKLLPCLGLAGVLAGFDAAAAPGACDLLNAAEIRAQQGEAPLEAKPQDTDQNGLHVSQCYFSLPTPAKSVSLTLTGPGEGAGALSPRAFWRDTFHADREAREHPAQGKDEEREGEEDAAAAKPIRVRGLGEEAFWAPSPVGGSLYVLQRDRFIRLSVGGPGNAQQKIGRSKALARQALKRLR